MNQYFKIDADGYIVETVVLFESDGKITDAFGNIFEEIPDNFIAVEKPGFWNPKWTGSEWVEAGEPPPEEDYFETEFFLGKSNEQKLDILRETLFEQFIKPDLINGALGMQSVRAVQAFEPLGGKVIESKREKITRMIIELMGD